MTQPNRPFVQVLGDLRAYFPIDADDAAFYDNFTKQLERYAFFEMVERINNGRIRRRPGSGNDVVALWKQRKAGLVKQGHGRSTGHRPDPAAQLPPGGAPAGPDPALAPVAPPVPVLTLIPVVSAIEIAPRVPSTPEPLQDALVPAVSSAPGEAPDLVAPDIDPVATSASNDAPSTPESICSSDGERSPRFIVRNDTNGSTKRYLSPTRGERMQIKEDLRGTYDLTWRFANTLYQTEVSGEDPSMPPTSVYLFVGLDTDGIIRNHTIAKLFDTKSLDQDINTYEFAEHKILKSMVSVNCSHLQQFLRRGGRTVRLTTRMIGEEEDDQTAQSAVHLYTGFAARGDLKNVCDAHHEAQRPIPEYFIWHTLKSLVEGMTAMRDGTCRSPRQEAARADPDLAPDLESVPKNWKPIVHLDLKPANVFLEDGNDERPGIPHPILGDLGIAETLPLPPTYPRENGTEGWLPPERNPYDKAANHASPYLPRDWAIDERSEVYSAGLIALSLTKAHKLTLAEQETETKELATRWLDSLSHQSDAMDGGRGPTRLDQLDPHYSVRLYKTLEKCLLTRPNLRHSLDDLRTDVDEEIQRIERRYGDKLKRDHDEMDEDLKIQTTWAKGNENPRAFPLGTRFSLPRKRRRVNNDDLNDALSTSFSTFAKDWNNSGAYTALSPDELTQLMIEFNRIVEKDTKFDEESAEFVTFRYLISILRRYVSRSMAVNYYTDSDWDNNYMQAFTVERRHLILQHVRANIIPHLPTSSTETDNAVRTFKHAVDWCIALNQAPGEPRQTQLTAPSVLHQAIRHFVFKMPSGAFIKDSATDKGMA